MAWHVMYCNVVIYNLSLTAARQRSVTAKTEWWLNDGDDVAWRLPVCLSYYSRYAIVT